MREEVLALHQLPSFRQGDIYWLDECPPLLGDATKRRPVIVVSSALLQAKSGGQLVVVACTSTVYSDDLDAVELPNCTQSPGASTGLTKRTWAIPRWFLVVRAEQLKTRAGFVTGNLLQRIVKRYDFHLERQLRRTDEETSGKEP